MSAAALSNNSPFRPMAVSVDYLLIDHHYRGRRGNLPRSLWYWFYPLHLAFLHFVKLAMTS